MKFLCIYKPSKPEGTPPTQVEMVNMGKLIEEFTNAGVLISTEGCLPSAKGAQVRMSGGKFTVTDGPFHRSQGDRGRVCANAGEFEGGDDRAHKEISQGRRRWRDRDSPDLGSCRCHSGIFRGKSRSRLEVTSIRGGVEKQIC